MSKNGIKYQYKENKLKTREEVNSGTSGVLIILEKAGNVKCDINIKKDLNLYPTNVENWASS
jgi:hypothetical protein